MSTYPCITAYTVRADTLFIFSFSMIFLRCVTTVANPMLSFAAISLLIYPRTMYVITSTSRSDNMPAPDGPDAGGRLRPCAWALCSRASNDLTRLR